MTCSSSANSIDVISRIKKALVGEVTHVAPEQLASSHRKAAVLINLQLTETDAIVTLIERAHTDVEHAGQVAFPGGRVSERDPSHIATALREAQEEIGLRSSSVEVLGEHSPRWIAPSRFLVTPVFSYWREPHDLTIDQREVHSVHQVSIKELAHPESRFQVRAPSGYIGPAFQTDTHLIWGFTALVLADLIQIIQYDEPWDSTRILEMGAD